MRILILTLLAMMLGLTTPFRAEASELSEEIFELWSAAYEIEDPNEIPVDAFHESAGDGWVPPANVDLQTQGLRDHEGASGSLTPHLDRLFQGGSHGGSSAISAAERPATTLRGIGHDAYFENPPMTSASMSKSDKDKDKDKKKDRDGKSCGHDGYCGCTPSTAPGPEPVPEPGTLLLAGMAGSAAWAARRRARRKAQLRNADSH